MTTFQIGDLVVNFGTIAVVDGEASGGDLLLKIVDCEKDGIRQGGRGLRYGAPEANCRLVEASDNVVLTHFHDRHVVVETCFKTLVELAAIHADEGRRVVVGGLVEFIAENKLCDSREKATVLAVQVWNTATTKGA